MEKIISVKNFSKNYGKVEAVKNISFDVEKGEIVGFVGKNGAGKSTTIRCMTNMLFPSSGSISILNMDSVHDAKEIKKRLSYMPSETEFYASITSNDLFKFSSKLSDGAYEKARELAKYFELDINKKISNLSLGNRKKVAVIIALMKKSDIIILDEPTSGLDPLMQNKFFDLMKKEAEKGCTIFLSSHNLTEIDKYCDRALIIKDGVIVDDLDMNTVKLNMHQMVSFKTSDGKEETFEFDGNINELVKDLSDKNLQYLEIKNKSVEDEFIDYYVREENHE